MSLLNAWVLPTEAVMAVDTDGVAQDGSRMPCSKLLPIPHLNAVIGLRGQAAFLGCLFLRCVSGSFSRFDELLTAMPAVLAEVDAMVPDELLMRDCRIGNELLVMGWSDAGGRMVARQFHKRDDMPAFSEGHDCDYYLSPRVAGVPMTQAAAEKIARAQVRWMREQFPNAACGGRLLMCRVTRKSLEIAHKASFPLQEAA